MLKGVVNAFPGRHAEDEGEQAGDERDEESLHLQEGEVAEDERAASQAEIELADVGGGREAGGKIHLEIALEVEEDGDEDEELFDADEDAPGLHRRKVSVLVMGSEC